MYRYAKQLKEAGFPQGEPDQYTTDGQWIPKEERIYIPSLSEVIKECGNYITSCQAGEDYYIVSKHKSYGIQTDVEKTASGKNLEEAVVNLWLTLNNKI